MNYAAVRQALGRRLENVPGVTRVYDHAPDRIVVPSIAVLPGEPAAEYHRASDGGNGGLIMLRFDVIVFAQRFDTVAAQNTLDDLISATPDVIEADQTLDATAQVVKVDVATNYGVVTVADTQYIGCRFAVEVYTR
jgi:hypothetical protein